MAQGLYQSTIERDACGFGLLAHVRGRASHDLLQSALGALARMHHRGAMHADGLSGDGCGLLMALPRAFFREEARQAGVALERRFAVGVLFIEPSADQTAVCRRFERTLEEHRWQVVHWRGVPMDQTVLGDHGRSTQPAVLQALVVDPSGRAAGAVERSLFVARRAFERQVGIDHATVVSLSARTICYKGLCVPANLPRLYPDLADPRMTTSIAVFHQRFSTNTSPQWRLAQPFRLLAHNGEINTVAGNRAWGRARAATWRSRRLADATAVAPDFTEADSDSASLDQMLEYLVQGGMSLPLALRTLIPPAWQNVPGLDADLRAFHQFYSLNTEPWDGPAGIVLTDGRHAVCATDRNGLRPARFAVTRNERIILASEAGVLDLSPSEIIRKGRIGPGDLLLVDTREGRIETGAEIDGRLSRSKPYQSWLRDKAQRLEPLLRSPQLTETPFEDREITYLERLFDLGFEERQQVLRVLAEAGKEAVGSMGDDAPLAMLSTRRRPLYDYFRQQFAQVTNPPIDPLRESIVMSLETNFGAESNLFDDTPAQAVRVVAESPVLSEAKFRKLLEPGELGLKSVRIPLVLHPGEQLPAALTRLGDTAAVLIGQGHDVLILDDRPADPRTVPLHPLLAVGAVHQQLAESGVRCGANLVVATGTARDPHQIACLLGFGATAVYPYLAYQSLAAMVRRGEIGVDPAHAGELGRAYRRGVNLGLYKILSRMGISTMWSYLGARLFEVIGLAPEVVQRCFADAADAGIGGIGFDTLAADLRAAHQAAGDALFQPAVGGNLRFVMGGEYHAWHPGVVQTLQRAVTSGDSDDYRAYAAQVNERPPMTLRDLLVLRRSDTPASLDEVESVEQILPRFESAGMSLGALSPEAHEALAVAMNRIGGRSNSGEGGEDPTRTGTERRSKIRQIASGRFGVTAEYLAHAEVLQIKIAQGAKPGEGGQLPGHKVDGLIARLRYARPGIGLISPPPHHDIYSIEDLAQLIFDLKEVNPEALVSVKLVARRGVGTIAAGVAKAHADIITLSGYDGGTGASPVTSVKHVGSAWELGLAETQQALRANGLRDRVRIQVDGGLKTGLDVVKAALLGAESYGFGTAPMVALGCKYLRICHLNTCATGIATQDAQLRSEHFKGLPERVIAYFRFVAEEVRELLSELGAASLAEIIGRTELLAVTADLHERHRGLDLSPLLADGGAPAAAPRHSGPPQPPHQSRNELAERIAADSESLLAAGGGTLAYRIDNTDRAIGGRLAGQLARHPVELTTPLRLDLTGSAGQSLGAWCLPGMEIRVAGEANDYVGKGMHGGVIVLRQPRDAAWDTETAPIAGNVCLYGATGGRFFAAGRVGERFAVRNSGAIGVVEGIGDHGCEYMTDGVALILGPTGRNFGAGMTGGFAYVLDSERRFFDRINNELIDIHRIDGEAMEAHIYYLRELLREHVEWTDSVWGTEVLERLREYLPLFWLVKPKAAGIGDLIESISRAA